MFCNMYRLLFLSKTDTAAQQVRSVGKDASHRKGGMVKLIAGSKHKLLLAIATKLLSSHT